jgi:hypothetical protein
MAYRAPWDPDPIPEQTPAPPAPPAMHPPPRRRGRRPAETRAVRAEPSNWLYHHLTVSGPAATVAGFAAAARGAGVTPWRLVADQLEEDVFLRAASQPPAERQLSIAGCHILARQFRSLVEAHHVRAVARIGRSQACPFDLHALLPVPAAILQLGPIHPAALAWLSEHWGITDRLRQVIERPDATTGRRLPRGNAVVGYGFFTAGETPHAAIARLATRWSALRFVLRPRPGD